MVPLIVQFGDKKVCVYVCVCVCVCVYKAYVGCIYVCIYIHTHMHTLDSSTIQYKFNKTFKSPLKYCMISRTYESRIGELIKAKGKWFPGASRWRKRRDAV